MIPATIAGSRRRDQHRVRDADRLLEREAVEPRRRGGSGAARDLEDPPCSSALTPSVATSGVIPNWVTARPLTSPEATQASTTSPIAAGSALAAVRVLRDDDRRQRDHPRHREVEPALLDHERLADARDRQDGGERQHREQGGAADAPVREQGADREQDCGRDPDRREAGHSQARANARIAAPPWERRSRFRTDRLRHQRDGPIGQSSHRRRPGWRRRRTSRVARA